MGDLLPEIIEKILVRLSVRDLIRCKSVCKSWKSLIADPTFIKSHLNHSYHQDWNNEEFRHRRITMWKDAHELVLQKFFNYMFFDLNDRYLVGSSNGLVCVSLSPIATFVINPSTREVMKLPLLGIPRFVSVCCWGFGYASSTDDYKVVSGVRKGADQTCFQVFSLRENNWKFVGMVNSVPIRSMGVLCNGALHYVAYNASRGKNIICSFDLSEEKFREVPQPDDITYRINVDSSLRLGTMNDCLCVYIQKKLPFPMLWIMKEYGMKASWEYLQHDCDIKFDNVHCFKHLIRYIRKKRPLSHNKWQSEEWLCKNRLFFSAPLFVESLVSPHFHKGLQRKRRATSSLNDTKVKGKDHILTECAVPSANEGSGPGASTNARV